MTLGRKRNEPSLAYTGGIDSSSDSPGTLKAMSCTCDTPELQRLSMAAVCTIGSDPAFSTQSNHIVCVLHVVCILNRPERERPVRRSGFAIHRRPRRDDKYR